MHAKELKYHLDYAHAKYGGEKAENLEEKGNFCSSSDTPWQAGGMSLRAGV